MTAEIPDRDGDGYLLDMATWSEDVGRAMAEADEGGGQKPAVAREHQRQTQPLGLGRKNG